MVLITTKIEWNLFRKWEAVKNVSEGRKIDANLPAGWKVIGNLQEGCSSEYEPFCKSAAPSLYISSSKTQGTLQTII